MLDPKVTIQKTESVQLWKQVVRMVDGGEDTCCAVDQWMRKWAAFNEYSVDPKKKTDDFRLFDVEFDIEFE